MSQRVLHLPRLHTPVTVLNFFTSAGIGRTGVLIAMETALSLLDRGRPVFPLDIVRALRDQRAMMVQTTVQPGSAGSDSKMLAQNCRLRCPRRVETR